MVKKKRIKRKKEKKIKPYTKSHKPHYPGCKIILANWIFGFHAHSNYELILLKSALF